MPRSASLDRSRTASSGQNTRPAAQRVARQVEDGELGPEHQADPSQAQQGAEQHRRLERAPEKQRGERDVHEDDGREEQCDQARGEQAGGVVDHHVVGAEQHQCDQARGEQAGGVVDHHVVGAEQHQPLQRHPRMLPW
jgi:hypothetical protein